MHEPEVDVAHGRPRRDGDGQREEANAALRVERAVDRVDDDVRAAVAELPGLLRHECHVADAGEAGEHHALGGGVDRGRVITALPCADDRFAVRPRRQVRQHVAHVAHRLAAEREPVSQADGRAGPR